MDRSPDRALPPRRRWRAALLPVFSVLVAVLFAGCAGAAPAAAPAPPPAPGPAAPRTVVSLTFDDGSSSQFLVLPLLLDRGMRGTFYINSGIVDRVDGSTMSWDQIRTLANAGNDVGGHTSTHAVLPALAPPEKQQEICGDRERLIAEGLQPVSFAYPTGAFDPVAQGFVRSCGYLSGRSAGDVSETGPNYAETIPPADPFVTRALNTPPQGPLTLAYLQDAVTAAAAHGGGWVQIVLHRVCQPSSLDYQPCMASEGPIDIGVFIGFVNWLAHSAPPGTVVRPVATVIRGRAIA